MVVVVVVVVVVVAVVVLRSYDGYCGCCCGSYCGCGGSCCGWPEEGRSECFVCSLRFVRGNDTFKFKSLIRVWGLISNIPCQQG